MMTRRVTASGSALLFLLLLAPAGASAWVPAAGAPAEPLRVTLAEESVSFFLEQDRLMMAVPAAAQPASVAVTGGKVEEAGLMAALRGLGIPEKELAASRKYLLTRLEHGFGLKVTAQPSPPPPPVAMVKLPPPPAPAAAKGPSPGAPRGAEPPAGAVTEAVRLCDELAGYGVEEGIFRDCRRSLADAQGALDGLAAAKGAPGEPAIRRLGQARAEIGLFRSEIFRFREGMIRLAQPKHESPAFIAWLEKSGRLLGLLGQVEKDLATSPGGK
jgi:hypothetical protein